MLLKSALFTVLVLIAQLSFAQQAKTQKKIDNANKTIEKTEDLIDSGTRLFNKLPGKSKKKDQPGDSSSSYGTPQPVERENKAENKNIERKQTDSQLKPGDVHPNAKVIDADILYPFNNGLATVSKGTALALINAKGEFFIPYNSQYDLSRGENPEILAIGGKYLNTNGKLLAESNSGGSWGLTKDQMYLENIKQDANSPKWSIRISDKNGKKYEIKNLPSMPYYIGEEMYVVQKERNDDNHAVMNFNGEYVTKFIYNSIGYFVNGMAVVSKIDEFGKRRYGYIDKTGKEVIPVMYSKWPTHFAGGLASIYPADKTEFAQAVINKKGEIVAKLPRERLIYYIGNGFFNYDPLHIMDTKGKVIAIKDFLASYGVESTASDREIMLHVTSEYVEHEFTVPHIQKADDGKMWYARYSKKNDFISSGFVDIKEKKVVEAAFEIYETRREPVFDPVTKLALVKLRLSKDNRGNTIYREGYINEDGVFMIVKGEKSKW
ncbi:WG repeat-containing protein [Agriterribacter sp.]|uniref:WG repeat-containing protein n=1 Tax=Agriterribacter sp. TaxID=2821509 RepID=UPI002CDC303F|nr:WG repeat-containing protein [Agriterribacter sp.]HRO47601.1 WG repeat-containing protein [Agriterribacter sp.]HRQ18690.1 WG repeat-containing protein [Agriterribacter sp.]